VFLEVLDERQGVVDVATGYEYSDVRPPRTRAAHREILDRCRDPASFKQSLQKQRVCIFAVLDGNQFVVHDWISRAR
jgi:hypothetical protein